MKLIHRNRRLLVLAIAIAVLGGIAAWQLSGTAQAHRDRAGRLHARAERPARRHPSTPGSNRIQPGGAMVGFACYVVRGGIEGARVRLVPLDPSSPVLRECPGHPCVEESSRARRLEVSGGGYRKALTAEPLRPLATCPDQALPPGFAVPLGR